MAFAFTLPKKADDVMVRAIARVPGSPQLYVAGWDNRRWRLWRWPTEVGSGALPAAVDTRADGIEPIAANGDGHVLAFGTAPLAADVWWFMLAFPLAMLALEELRKAVLRWWWPAERVAGGT